jgi:hypothetical protein
LPILALDPSSARHNEIRGWKRPENPLPAFHFSGKGANQGSQTMTATIDTHANNLNRRDFSMRRRVLFSDPAGAFRAESLSLSLTRGNSKGTVNSLLLHFAAAGANRAAKSFVFSFFRLNRLESHIWREIFCKSHAFTFPGTPDISEIPTPSQLVH